MRPNNLLLNIAHLVSLFQKFRQLSMKCFHLIACITKFTPHTLSFEKDSICVMHTKMHYPLVSSLNIVVTYKQSDYILFVFFSIYVHR